MVPLRVPLSRTSGRSQDHPLLPVKRIRWPAAGAETTRIIRLRVLSPEARVGLVAFAKFS